jgi:hypothetical protein
MDSGSNATAVEAISDKLSEVTGLAEQLDASLCGVQHGSNIKRILEGTATTTPEVCTPTSSLSNCYLKSCVKVFCEDIACDVKSHMHEFLGRRTRYCQR